MSAREKINFIDDMRYGDDEQDGQLLDYNINLVVECKKCGQDIPVQKGEWDEIAYTITIDHECSPEEKIDEFIHTIESDFMLHIRCDSCENLHPAEVKWENDMGYVAKIIPHICTCYDDDIAENLAKLVKSVLSEEDSKKFITHFSSLLI